MPKCWLDCTSRWASAARASGIAVSINGKIFRDSWDQVLWPLTVVSLDQYRTYNLGLVQFGEDYGNPPTEQMAIAVLATIPVFVLFWVLQRLVNKGFGLSGLK